LDQVTGPHLEVISPGAIDFGCAGLEFSHDSVHPHAPSGPRGVKKTDPTGWSHDAVTPRARRPKEPRAHAPEELGGRARG
jgi:hypothetical protein